MPPAYTAVMLCVATDSAVVVRVAMPVVPLEVAVPIGVAPSKNVTSLAEDVGMPVPGETTATVAVNVTDWPDTEGFVPETSAVVVLAAFTVCVSADEVLVVCPASPAKTAVILCAVVDSVEVA